MRKDGKKNPWRHKLVAARPVLLSVLLGWCGADRAMLGRPGVEQMVLGLFLASVGLVLVAIGGPYHGFGAVLFFAAGAYVLYGWWFSVDWSIDEMRKPPGDGLEPLRLQIAEYGPVCGHYRGKPIWAWVRTAEGVVLEFKETLGGRSAMEAIEEGSGNGERLAVLNDPGLVYRVVMRAPGVKRVARRRAARCRAEAGFDEEDVV